MKYLVGSKSGNLQLVKLNVKAFQFFSESRKYKDVLQYSIVS